MQKLTIYTDGGARGNPGPAGAGAVVLDDTGAVITEISAYLGEQTNNYAEYEAIISALEYCKDEGLTDAEIELRADSKLAIEQLSGNWKVKHPNVRAQFLRAQALITEFASITFTHVPREENAHADMLANRAMDARH